MRHYAVGGLRRREGRACDRRQGASQYIDGEDRDVTRPSIGNEQEFSGGVDHRPLGPGSWRQGRIDKASQCAGVAVNRKYTDARAVHAKPGVRHIDELAAWVNRHRSGPPVAGDSRQDLREKPAFLIEDISRDRSVSVISDVEHLAEQSVRRSGDEDNRDEAKETKLRHLTDHLAFL